MSDDPTPEAGLERALRDRLRAVDDLTPPPPPDFAARAMAAARTPSPSRPEHPEHPEHRAPVVPLHRRSWARALVAVAATVVLGTGVVAGIQHLGGAGSASSSGFAQPENGVGGPTADRASDAPPGEGSAAAGPRASLLATASATGASTTSLPDAVARLQQRLLEPPYDVARASATLRGRTVVVTLPAVTSGPTSPDPALADLVAGLLPSGTAVEYRAG